MGIETGLWHQIRTGRVRLGEDRVAVGLGIKSGDIWGGLAAMLVALPSAIAFGVLVFSAIDPALAGQGALFGMLGAAALGLVSPLAGGTPALISAPCAPSAAILAALAMVAGSNPTI